MDLNLLLALDALLEDRSVGNAARRLHTSAPAMSRTLARLRRVLDDPVLVRAGRAMVPTPRALAMQGEVRALVEQARMLFAPPAQPDPASLDRTFTVQTGDGLFMFGTRLLARVRAEAPHVRLRFVGESREDTHALRDGGVDLEFGELRRTEPEAVVEHILTDQMIGVARADHELLSRRVTLRRFAAAEHVVYSRRGHLSGPIDDLLAEHGLRRRVAACAPNPAGALFLLKASDLVGVLPSGIGQDVLHELGLEVFQVPLELPRLELSMAWHPRFDSDGPHRWLRQCVRDALLA